MRPGIRLHSVDVILPDVRCRGGLRADHNMVTVAGAFGSGVEMPSVRDQRSTPLLSAERRPSLSPRDLTQDRRGEDPAPAKARLTARLGTSISMRSSAAQV